MKIFQLFRKYWALLGVEQLQPFQKNQRVKSFLKRLPVFIVCVLWFICLTVFTGCEAAKIDEYADAFYISSCVMAILFTFAITLWKMDNLVKLIEDFENLISQRRTISNIPHLMITKNNIRFHSFMINDTGMSNAELKQKYVNLNENIEKWSGIIFKFYLQVNVAVIFMPNFVVSFYLYFATDLSGEAFSLPFPAW